MKIAIVPMLLLISILLAQGKVVSPTGIDTDTHGTDVSSTAASSLTRKKNNSGFQVIEISTRAASSSMLHGKPRLATDRKARTLDERGGGGVRNHHRNAFSSELGSILVGLIPSDAAPKDDLGEQGIDMAGAGSDSEGGGDAFDELAATKTSMTTETSFTQLSKASTSKIAVKSSTKVPKSKGPKKGGSPKKTSSPNPTSQPFAAPTSVPTVTQRCVVDLDIDCLVNGNDCGRAITNTGQDLIFLFNIDTEVTTNPFTIVNVTIEFVFALEDGTNLMSTDVLTSKLEDPFITSSQLLMVNTSYPLISGDEGTLGYRAEVLGETPTGVMCSIRDDDLFNIQK